jgi:hypothetical protein
MDYRFNRMFENQTRKGNTGIWTFVMITEEGNVMATSEWGTNYEFDPMYWELLPIC